MDVAILFHVVFDENEEIARDWKTWLPYHDDGMRPCFLEWSPWLMSWSRFDYHGFRFFWK